MGRLVRMASNTKFKMTTIQREVWFFTKVISSVALSFFSIAIIVWAAWLRNDHPDYINVSALLIDVVSVMVAFIPEGLPIAVTISLAKVAHTLSSHKVLCKSLSIVEVCSSCTLCRP